MKYLMNGLFPLILLLVLYKSFKYVEKLDNEIKVHVGEQVMIKGERHEILDYDLFSRTYILDDATIISVDYVLE